MEKLPFPDPLQPRPKMKVNDPCWCGSGKKWKKCHRDRSSNPRPNYFSEAQKLRKSFGAGECQHPDAPVGCSTGVIRSHTIQRSGGLRAIAENGHVLWARDAVHMLTKTGGELIPQRVGVKEASTFPGFCAVHDGSLFQPIEGRDVPLSREAACLIALRSIAREIQCKAAVATKFMADGDKGSSFAFQAGAQQYIADMVHGFELGLKDARGWKVQLDAQVRTKQFAGLSMLAAEFDDLLPIVASGAFAPEHDFLARPLQRLDQVHVDHIAMLLTSYSGRSVFYLVWADSPGNAAERFAKSFSSLDPARKAAAACQACFTFLENTLIKPSFWNQLNSDEQGRVSQLLRVGLPHEGRIPESGALLKRYSPFDLATNISSEKLLENRDSEWT